MSRSATSAGGAWREVRSLVRAQRRNLATGLALVAVSRGAAMVMPLATRVLVDDVVGRRRGSLLLPLAAVVAAAIAIEGASGYAASRVAGVGAERALTALRTSLQARVVRLPLGALDRLGTGALVARVLGDVEQARPLTGQGLVQLAGGVLTASLALALLLSIDAPLTLAVVVLLALAAWWATGRLDRLRATWHAMAAAQAALAGRLLETLLGVRVVKAYAAERGEGHAFRRGAHALLRESARAQGTVAALSATATAFSGLVGLLVLTVGGRAVLEGAMTIGGLVTFLFATGLLATPVLQIAAGAGDTSRALAALGRIGALRAQGTEDEEDRARGAAPVPAIGGDVLVDRVGYRYAAGRPALDDVAFAIAAGSTTALVGRSGAGKSTLCHLLLAYDRPTRGRVLVDGRDLASLRRVDYRRHLGLVPQDGFLFDGSLADNIRVARPAATLAEVRAAAAAAQCDEFADRLPRGYDTAVGERGLALSGGQRQRVAIARALLADPRILILDEATSHLDAESDALVRAALRALTRGRTTVVVAHHMASVADADQVVMLDHGRVVAIGAPAALLADGGPYHRLFGPAAGGPQMAWQRMEPVGGTAGEKEASRAY